MAKVFIVTGSSQVGKSSLIKLLAPPTIATTISVGDATGKSVTSEVKIYRFHNAILGDVMIIDIPGQKDDRKTFKSNTQLLEYISKSIYVDFSSELTTLNGILILDNLNFDTCDIGHTLEFIKSLFPSVKPGTSCVTLFTHKDLLEQEELKAQVTARSQICKAQGIQHMTWSNTKYVDGNFAPVPAAQVEAQTQQLKGLLAKLSPLQLASMTTFEQMVKNEQAQLHRNQPKRTKTIMQDEVKTRKVQKSYNRTIMEDYIVKVPVEKVKYVTRKSKKRILGIVVDTKTWTDAVPYIEQVDEKRQRPKIITQTREENQNYVVQVPHVIEDPLPLSDFENQAKAIVRERVREEIRKILATA